jgi:acyl-CoA reductase-like NAD-dependent aldehyde dehydrogenase
MSTSFTVSNPTNGQTIDIYSYATAEEREAATTRAYESFTTFRHSSIEQRIAGINALGALLADNRDTFAHQITYEMGKLLAQALAEIDKCIATCTYYAENLADLLTPQCVDLSPDNASAKIHLRPLGVVLAILPWNYPWWQVVRAMLPAIAVGNTVVLKHADNVSGCAVTVAETFNQAFNATVMTPVFLSPEGTSDAIADPNIAAVTFTGSERVGALVAEKAGSVLKKCVLELGGSDPFIVLDDANIAEAARAAARSRFTNNGESCIAAKRILVQESIYDQFIDNYVTECSALTIGDPSDAESDIGPVARFDLQRNLDDQLAQAISNGDHILYQGTTTATEGAWFAPTVVKVSSLDSPIFTDETFGPLSAVSTFNTIDDALSIANSSKYGLSSSIWTQDDTTAEYISERIDAGSVFINSISVSDPRLPVGGIKQSGYGRELGEYGIREFANVQAVRTTH